MRVTRDSNLWLKIQRQEQKRSDLDEQLKEYIAEWRKQRAKEEEELKRLKVKSLYISCFFFLFTYLFNASLKDYMPIAFRRNKPSARLLARTRRREWLRGRRRRRNVANVKSVNDAIFFLPLNKSAYLIEFSEIFQRRRNNVISKRREGKCFLEYIWLGYFYKIF